MVSKVDSNKKRLIRHKRVRAKISGTAERPRLNVFRSLSNIYAQIIDDVAGNTLCSASTVEKEFDGNGGNVVATLENTSVETVSEIRAKVTFVEKTFGNTIESCNLVP